MTARNLSTWFMSTSSKSVDVNRKRFERVAKAASLGADHSLLVHDGDSLSRDEEGQKKG